MAETDIDIYGGHSQVNPAATQAIQNNYYIRLVPERETTACTVVVPDAEVDTAAGSPTTYGLYVQHDSVDVPSLLRKAERHVVLHAAYYPKYGLDSQGMVLMEAGHLHPYGQEPVAEGVRPHTPSALYGKGLHQGSRTLQGLFPQDEGTGPSRTGGDFLHPTASPVPGHPGPEISGMYEALTERRLDVTRLTDEEKAILRYVEECVPAAF